MVNEIWVPVGKWNISISTVLLLKRDIILENLNAKLNSYKSIISINRIEKINIPIPNYQIQRAEALL